MIPLHGIGSRADLPLPFSFVVAGSAAALALSFLILVFAWRRPRFAEVGGAPVPLVQRLVDNAGARLAVRLVVLMLFAWVGLALALGQDRLTNPVFGFVYVWVWVGLVPLSLVFGHVWRATNPLRTVHDGLCRLAGIDSRSGLLWLPERLGVWPAAVGLFGFAWLELVQPNQTTLAVLRLWVLGWLLVMIIGAVVFGQRWIGAADPFETYAGTVAELSPWWREPAVLRLVNPLAHLARWSPPPGTVGVVSVLLGSTAFDSFTNTTWWIGTVQSSSISPVWWETVGLLTMIGIVLLSFSAAAAWMSRYPAARRARVSPGEATRLMSASVVPIVVGYAVAHYATLLVIEGQRTAINLSDPLGRGWNVFGTAGLEVSPAIASYPTAVALLQLGAIVTGHLLGIVSAHERAVSLLRPEAALQGQWPMLVVMVGYTCAGLLLLFSP